MAYEAAMRLIMRLANQTALVMTIAFDGVNDGRVNAERVVLMSGPLILKLLS